MQIARKRRVGSDKVRGESFGRIMRGQTSWGDQSLDYCCASARHSLARAEKCTVDNCNGDDQNPKREDERKRYLFRSLTGSFTLPYVSNIFADLISWPRPWDAVT